MSSVSWAAEVWPSPSRQILPSVLVTRGDRCEERISWT